MRRTTGFTLVEVLIGLLISSLIAGSLLVLFGSTTTIAADAGARAREYRELQNTAAVVGDDVRQARFIYPVGQGFAIDTTIALGAPNVAGPTIVAMFLPRQEASICPANNFEFVAYYLAARSNYVGGAEWTDPGADTENANAFALMQYRACASAPGPGAVLTVPFIRMVADYIDSAGTSFAYDPGAVNNVTVNLRSRRVIRGRVLFTPGATSSVSFNAFARNL